MDSMNSQTFLALLLLYVSGIEGSLNDDELDFMRKEVGDDAMHEAERIYRHHSEFELIDLLQKTKERHYPGSVGTDVLMRELTNYFESDGDFSNWEKAIARVLKKIFQA